MEVVNDASRLVAQALERLKGSYKENPDYESWEKTEVEGAIKLLEEALEKLAAKI